MVNYEKWFLSIKLDHYDVTEIKLEAIEDSAVFLVHFKQLFVTGKKVSLSFFSNCEKSKISKGRKEKICWIQRISWQPWYLSDKLWT